MKLFYLFYAVNKVASNRAPAKIGGLGNRSEPGKVDELSSQVLKTFC